MENDYRVQCLVFVVHDNDRPENERPSNCTRKLRSSTAREQFPRRCSVPRTLRNTVSASVPLARAFVMLPEVFLKEHQSFLALLQQNDILVVNSKNFARLLVGNDYLEVFEILLDGSPSASVDPLYFSAPKMYINVVRLLISNVRVRFKYVTNNTVIRLAVDKMNLKYIKRLLNHGEILLEFGYHEILGSYYGTLLHMAIFCNDVALACLLLKYGTDVHRLMFRESTLHLAAKFCPQLIQVLIDKGVSVDIVDYRGNSPLHCASTVEAAEILLQNGANVNITCNHLRQTPLMKAVGDGNIALIKTLLYYGANVNAKDYRNRSILEIAFRRREPDVLEFLLEFCFSDFNNIFTSCLVDFYQFLITECDRYRRNHINYPDSISVTAYYIILIEYLRAHVLNYQHVSVPVADEDLKIMEEELAKMSMPKLCGTDISFFDILTKSTDQVASLMRNEAISNILRSLDFDAQFPMYGTILKYQFQKGRQRRNIQLIAGKICSRLFSNFKNVPDEVQGMIMGHLSTQDVMILRRVCMTIKT